MAKNKGRTQKEWSMMINYAESKKIAEMFELSPITEDIYRAIRSFKSNKDHTAFPELETIAAVSGYCKNTVIKHIRIMEDKGIIIKQRRKKRNKKGVLRDISNLYTFAAEKMGRAIQSGLVNREVIIEEDAEKKIEPTRQLSPMERLDWLKGELLEMGDYTKKQINKIYLQVKEEMQKGTYIQSISSYVGKALENLAELDEFRKEDQARLKALREFNAGRRDALCI